MTPLDDGSSLAVLASALIFFDDAFGWLMACALRLAVCLAIFEDV